MSLFVFRTNQWMWRIQFLFQRMMIPQKPQFKSVHLNKFMIKTSHQTFTIRIRKKKLQEPLNDFDSDEDNDGDNKNYQEKIWELTDKRKVNSTLTISSIRAGPNSRLRVPLCCIVPMPIVRPALKCDITKLEADFFNGYRDGDLVFYLSATDSGKLSICG